MASSSASSFEDVAVLSRVVENVFRRLIRILVGRMTLKKLQEMIQVIFVQETEAKLKKEAPGKSVALGDLSLLTGVDTRTIKKARSFIALSDPMHMNQEFLDGFMPFFKLFDLWLNHADYRDGKTGKPKVLKIAGEGKTFTQLVRAAMPARGLTLYAILKRLKDIGVIEEDAEKGTVRLLQEDYIFISRDELDLIDVGFTAIANLARTVEHNIGANSDNKFYQRGVWTYRLSKKNQRAFQRTMAEFLHKVDEQAKCSILPFEEQGNDTNQITAGVSFFYFEEEPTQFF